ncbi:hypothetical protein Poly30_07280 [Planctomycetes bacterium Poly30]|uniref:Uncharacterized protein n=1 Tax=Saltatorellus ferox TaxID=2528018 RepID=A0A518EMB1_9BACT|nr:hypothetical protein Poly30_07280 [Planctomycetes bacterium Poly30]
MVLNVGPDPGRVQVTGASSGTETFTGVRAIVAMTGAGEDTFRVTGASPYLPRLFLDTGTGESEVLIQFTYTSSPFFSRNSAGIFFQGGDEEDDLEILLDAADVPLLAVVDATLGNGINALDLTLTTLGDDTDAEGIVIASGGSGQDTIELDVGSLNSLSAVANLSGNLGGGNDRVFTDVESRFSGASTLVTSLDLGAGNDSFRMDADGADVFLGGTIDGSTGADQFQLRPETGLIGALTVEAGAGNDTITMVSRRDNASASQLRGGDGDDTVEVRVLSGSQVTDTSSDGGPGLDTFRGIGARSNFEIIQ